jgi:glucose-6-phosphate isomerase
MTLLTATQNYPRLAALTEMAPDATPLPPISAATLRLSLARQFLPADFVSRAAALLKEQGFESARADMASGQPVNASENRAVRHMDLRKANPPAEVKAELDRALAFAEKMRRGEIKGQSGKTIRHVIHIGIGGSDLGPRLVAQALGDHQGPQVHFIANVDGGPVARLMRTLDPEETYILIASKTFTTAETMLNAKTLRGWLKADTQMAALTTAPEKARDFGIPAENIFRFFDWVGGRFSVWSVIGLPAMIALGEKAFREFLGGAAEMDTHFMEAPLEQNAPVLLAALDIWNGNVKNRKGRAVLPYTQALSLLPSYLQQLEMESLGKSVTKDGMKVDYMTGGIVFGMAGTDAQHAFMQALHQGTEIIPAEFLLVARDADHLPDHHMMLLANGLAQGEALAAGKKDAASPHRHFDGGRPSTTIVLDALTPRSFGALLALYEHKVFTLGVFWNLNPFDQWGVELGKQLASDPAVLNRLLKDMARE